MKQEFGKNKVTSDKRQTGFSIIELVVGMTVFLIVTGAVLSVLSIARQSRTTVNQEAQLSKAVRVGLDLIGRDTYNAGYGYPLNSTVVLPDNRISGLLLIPNDFDTTRDTIPPIIAGNNITLNNINATANTRTDQVTLLFKDTTFNTSSGVSQPLNINAPTTNASGIDEIVPISGSNSACTIGDIYLVTGNTGSALGVATALSGTNKVQFANADVLGFNQAGTSLPGITLPASMQKVRMITYFVATDGTLTRREYANRNPAAAFVDSPLVYQVQDFQIKYVMDDGTVVDNPSAGADGIAGTADDDQVRLKAVRQIRFTISVLSTENGATSNANTVAAPYVFTMTSTFSTRNLGYEAN
jgi:type II secretory pathway pseudopilin PulG